jgi:peptidoglycan-associated lipoprotein
MKRLTVAIMIVIVGVVFMGCPKKTAPPPLPPVVDNTPVVVEPKVEKVTEPAKKTLNLKPVNFDYNKYGLTDEAKAVLADNAQQLMDFSDVSVSLEGHCDERGTEQYNLSLGQKRADAVKTFLINYGVSSGRITTISYGEEKPVCREANEGCWWRNRRVDFKTK